MKYYAFEHIYGGDVFDIDGNHIVNVYWFSTKQNRDQWVKGWEGYFSSPGFRERVSARLAKKYACEDDMECGDGEAQHRLVQYWQQEYPEVNGMW